MPFSVFECYEIPKLINCKYINEKKKKHHNYTKRFLGVTPYLCWKLVQLLSWLSCCPPIRLVFVQTVHNSTPVSENLVMDAKDHLGKGIFLPPEISAPA